MIASSGANQLTGLGGVLPSQVWTELLEERYVAIHLEQYCCAKVLAVPTCSPWPRAAF